VGFMVAGSTKGDMVEGLGDRRVSRVNRFSMNNWVSSAREKTGASSDNLNMIIC
jgi:hypothetical protein